MACVVLYCAMPNLIDSVKQICCHLMIWSSFSSSITSLCTLYRSENFIFAYHSNLSSSILLAMYVLLTKLIFYSNLSTLKKKTFSVKLFILMFLMVSNKNLQEVVSICYLQESKTAFDCIRYFLRYTYPKTDYHLFDLQRKNFFKKKRDIQSSK